MKPYKVQLDCNVDLGLSEAWRIVLRYQFQICKSNYPFCQKVYRNDGQSNVTSKTVVSIGS